MIPSPTKYDYVLTWIEIMQNKGNLFHASVGMWSRAIIVSCVHHHHLLQLNQHSCVQRIATMQLYNFTLRCCHFLIYRIYIFYCNALPRYELIWLYFFRIHGVIFHTYFKRVDLRQRRRHQQSFPPFSCLFFDRLLCMQFFIKNQSFSELRMWFLWQYLLK